MKRFMFLVAFLFVVAPQAFAQTAITSCGQINAAGVYSIANDLTVASGDCLTVNAANVTLYRNGKNIASSAIENEPGVAIQINGDDFVFDDTIPGGCISGFYAAFRGNGARPTLNNPQVCGTRYWGGQLGGVNATVNGGLCQNIAGVTNEPYAQCWQFDGANPVVIEPHCKNIYRQTGYQGTAQGEGLCVNFAAVSTGGALLGGLFENDEFKLDTIGAFLGVGGGHVASGFRTHNIFKPIQRATANNSDILSAFGTVSTTSPSTIWPATPNPKFVFASDSNGTEIYVAGSSNVVNLIAAGIPGSTAVNSSLSGNQSWQLLARLQTDVIAHNPTIVGVMIGTNDGATAYEQSIPASVWIPKYLGNMARIIDTLKAASIPKIMIASPPPARINRLSDEWPQALAGLKALCAAKGVRYVPLYEAFDAEAINRIALSSSTPLYRPDLDKYHWDTAGHAFAAPVFVTAYEDGEEPPPPSGGFGAVLSETLAAFFGNVEDKTIRLWIAKTALTLPQGSVTKIKVTLRGATDEPITYAKMYVGHSAGGDDATGLIQLKVGCPTNCQTSWVVPAGGTVVAEADFAYNKTSDLLFSSYHNGGPSSDKLRAHSSFSNAITHHKYGDEAALATIEGLYPIAGYLSGVEKIEMDGF